LVTFSGEVIDPDLGGTFTEVAVNQGIEEKQPSEKFAGDDYQLLVVAEKYQTDFDQPLLHTMNGVPMLPEVADQDGCRHL
jgi:type I restriction enzyme R subunit